MKFRILAALALVLYTGLYYSETTLAKETETYVTPRLQWAQRRHMLYLRILCPVEIINPRITLNDTRLFFEAEAKEGVHEANGTTFMVEIYFYRRLESKLASWQGGRKEVQLTLPKKWSVPYWPRLFRHPQDPLKAFTATDWSRWKPQEEDGDEHRSSLSDEDIEAEEAAIIAPASFPDEEYDDLELLLLANETAFVKFLDENEVVSVLFFDRAMPESRTLHRVFASIGPHMKHRVPVAVMDGKENGRLMKRMQVAQYPMSKLFFRNGDMFEYNAKEIGYTGLLIKFLVRQLEPAFVELETEEEALVFLNTHPKAVVGYFEGSRKLERTFETVAKRFRADPDPKLHGIFAKLSDEASTVLTTDGRFKHVPDGFRGVLFVKKEEPLQIYDGNPKWRILHSWVYRAQFNLLEEITHWNFKEFRRRRLPVVYIILDTNLGSHEDMLAEVRQVAHDYHSNISFVYTNIARTGDLLEHLRCEYHGHTYAVLEDFVEDYRYCIETDAKRKLTMSRIRKLCDGFLARLLNPDHVRSEPVPKSEVGPLYTVVADTLMHKAMDPTKDVVLHFYASFDENWDDQEHVLEKVAEDFEDVPTFFMGKIDGMKNERPPQFPDLGYFPCTWIFPAKRKMHPVSYNSSTGTRMEYQSLKDFILTYASYPLQLPKTKRLTGVDPNAVKVEL